MFIISCMVFHLRFIYKKYFAVFDSSTYLLYKNKATINEIVYFILFFSLFMNKLIKKPTQSFYRLFISSEMKIVCLKRWYKNLCKFRHFFLTSFEFCKSFVWIINCIFQMTHFCSANFHLTICFRAKCSLFYFRFFLFVYIYIIQD